MFIFLEAVVYLSTDHTYIDLLKRYIHCKLGFCFASVYLSHHLT